MGCYAESFWGVTENRFGVLRRIVLGVLRSIVLGCYAESFWGVTQNRFGVLRRIVLGCYGDSFWGTMASLFFGGRDEDAFLGALLDLFLGRDEDLF